VINGFAERIQRTLRDRMKSTYDVELDKTPPPPRPPEPSNPIGRACQSPAGTGTDQG